MYAYTIRRILLIPITLPIISMIVFLLARLIPGDVVDVIRHDVTFATGNMISMSAYLGWALVIVMLINITTGIFRLKKSSLNMCLWGSIVFTAWAITCFFSSLNPLRFMGIGEIGYLVYALIFIVPSGIFLTRPKVKKQFS